MGEKEMRNECFPVAHCTCSVYILCGIGVHVHLSLLSLLVYGVKY